ncbi:hypothetical protein HPB49_005491 [Dermacentor silvarum]|uniref:Uncharacterized protein n=1 Tax=Dermacentor silvarum TaxID=543639 RepID=A0ACB8DVR3_DERSI|nr:hypothetical protein HPB49_005491 [Dermacentor silvarum]
MLCCIVMDSGIRSAFGGNPDRPFSPSPVQSQHRHCSRAAMSSRGKYRAKTLKEKVEILRGVDAGKQSKNEIAKKHDIPRSTLSTYIRNKKTIEDSYAAETFAKDRKRIRTAKHPDLEAAEGG